MNVHLRDLLSSIVVIVFGSAAFIMAGDFGASGRFPRLVSGIMVGAAGLMLIRSIFRPPALAVTEDDAPSDFRRLTSDEVARTTIAIVLTLIYIALVRPLGFFTASLIYIPVSAYALGLRSHVAIWVGTLLYIGFSYWLFSIVFHTPLPSELVLRLL